MFTPSQVKNLITEDNHVASLNAFFPKFRKLTTASEGVWTTIQTSAALTAAMLGQGDDTFTFVEPIERGANLFYATQVGEKSLLIERPVTFNTGLKHFSLDTYANTLLNLVPDGNFNQIAEYRLFVGDVYFGTSDTDYLYVRNLNYGVNNTITCTVVPTAPVNAKIVPFVDNQVNHVEIEIRTITNTVIGKSYITITITN